MTDTVVRKLERKDLDAGFLESLDSLRSASGMPKELAAKIFDTITLDPNHRIFVAERNRRVVGAATLFIERKFIHNGGLVGHIEDVTVRKDEQRTGVGSMLIRHLTDEAKSAQCYKTVLDCTEALVPYYERLGFSRHSVTMRIDLD